MCPKWSGLAWSLWRRRMFPALGFEEDHLSTTLNTELDPTFSGTRECKFLQDLATAIMEVDDDKFTGVVKEFDSMSRLDQWKTTLLLRAKNALKNKEQDDTEDLM